ncbi:MAG: NADH-quinone oxidoreductase subunit NuoE [Chloroflexi bacterium]|nr:NADH-quinone oxidoreductase subunit NuoE [Chloroflexota bacterium]MBL7061303.1 NADH-quinone oxidoreductase subunit NuoE [Dehalococcoidia bacterium]
MKNECDVVEVIINKYGGNHDSVIAILQDIQSEYHYLPETALRVVAKNLELPLIQVYGVATFFKAFSLKPRGEHLIKLCVGTACHVRGAQPALDEVKRQLGIEAGETTEDMMFTLETVNCLGACALGPIMVVGEEYHGEMSPKKIKKILSDYKKATRSRRHDEIRVGT